jgi:hypothetical protein
MRREDCKSSIDKLGRMKIRKQRARNLVHWDEVFIITVQSLNVYEHPKLYTLL